MRSLNLKSDTQTSTDISSFSINEILTKTKIFGFIYFIRYIADSLNLLDYLSSSIVHLWRTIFALACFILYSRDSFSEAHNWLNDQYIYDIGNNLRSQRISELLNNGISEIDRNLFYKKWYTAIKDREFVALDTTSISTYSENIENAEWGFNKKGENLKQINVCLLFGEQSHLPIYQSIYGGSLKDSATLRSTLEQFSSIVGGLDINIVMDKGFYSNKNIKHMKNRHIKFIIAVPFTSKKAKELIEIVRPTIDEKENIIYTDDDSIRGLCYPCIWDNDLNVNAHIYFNVFRHQKIRNDLYLEIDTLVNKYKNNILSPDDEKKFNKYIIKNNNFPINHKKHISFNNNEIEKSLQTAGWFVLITNTKFNSQRIYLSYRLKDVVEKSFCAYNNSLGLERFRVHIDNRVKNKLFISLIALILESNIRMIIKNSKLYKKITLQQVIREMSKITCFVDKDGNIRLRSLSAKQKLIFDEFNIPYPSELYKKNEFCINKS
jgi:transposase